MKKGESPAGQDQGKAKTNKDDIVFGLFKVFAWFCDNCTKQLSSDGVR